MMFYFVLLFVGSVMTTCASDFPGFDNYKEVKGKCFVGRKGFYNYDGASSHCVNRGLNLASIANNDENNVAQSVCSSMGFGACWMGFNNLSTEGDWGWKDGSPVTLLPIPWAPGEPNHSGDCGQIYDTGKWDDYICSGRRHVICSGKGGGLGPGAIAGIVVGSVFSLLCSCVCCMTVFVVLVAVLVIFFQSVYACIQMPLVVTIDFIFIVSFIVLICITPIYDDIKAEITNSAPDSAKKVFKKKKKETKTRRHQRDNYDDDDESDSSGERGSDDDDDDDEEGEVTESESSEELVDSDSTDEGSEELSPMEVMRREMLLKKNVDPANTTNMGVYSLPVQPEPVIDESSVPDIADMADFVTYQDQEEESVQGLPGVRFSQSSAYGGVPETPVDRRNTMFVGGVDGVNFLQPLSRTEKIDEPSAPTIDEVEIPKPKKKKKVVGDEIIVPEGAKEYARRNGLEIVKNSVDGKYYYVRNDDTGRMNVIGLVPI